MQISRVFHNCKVIHVNTVKHTIHKYIITSNEWLDKVTDEEVLRKEE